MSVWTSRGRVGSTLGGLAALLAAAGAWAWRPSHPPVPADDPDRACLECHRALTERPVTHGPVAVGVCTACHTVRATGEGAVIGLAGGATAQNTRALCTACHEEIEARLNAGHTHAPVAAGACTACHDPHGSADRFQLVAADQTVCLRCHEDIAEALAGRVVHRPASTSCAICHDPHGTAFEAVLRAPVQHLCLTCHSVRGPSEPLGGAPIPETLFDRRLTIDESRAVRSGPPVGLDLQSGQGHPVVGHPVAAIRDPMRPGRPLTCGSCHDPHATDGGKLFRFGATNTSDLCLRCHRFDAESGEGVPADGDPGGR